VRKNNEIGLFGGCGVDVLGLGLFFWKV